MQTEILTTALVKFIPYYGFNAVVILYFLAIQNRAEAPEAYMKYFRLASRCHAQIEDIATKGSLMDRYGVVLQELRLEVLRNKNQLDPMSGPQVGGASMSGDADATPVETRDQAPPRIDPALQGSTSGAQLVADAAGNAVDSMGSFDSALLHMAGWGQFDSLVMPLLYR